MLRWWKCSTRGDDEEELRRAAEKGDLDSFLHGFQKKPNDVKRVYKQTPLHWASANGYESLVRQLLSQKGIDVDARDINEKTPLHWATGSGHVSVVALLLEHGADVHAKNIAGDSLLHIACSKGSWRPERTEWEFSRLYCGYSADIPNCEFSHFVNGKGYKAILELLLQHGADIEVRDESGQTPLHCATKDALTTLLLKHGADVNAKDNEGKTATQDAEFCGHRESAAAMEPFVKCDSRAQLDLDIYRLQQVVNSAKDSFDPTVIANAMDASRRLERRMPIGQYKQFPTAAELEKQISDLESTLDQLPIGKEKLDQSMKLQDLKQRLGREMAAQRELNGEIAPTDEVSMESNRKANFGEETFFKAIEKGILEQVVYFLTHGANPNGKNDFGTTLLSVACSKGEEAIAALLLAFGADIDAKDNNGQTPLHAAAFCGRKAMVKLLLEHGADNFIENNQGKTAYKVSRYECFEIFHPFQDFRTRAALNLEIKRLEQKLNTDRTPDYLDKIGSVGHAKRKLDSLQSLCQCKRFASAAMLQELIAKREGELGKLKERLASEIAAKQCCKAKIGRR